MAEVAVALHIFGQKDEVVAAAVTFHILAFQQAAFAGHIHLAPDDGLERVFLVFLVELLHLAHEGVDAVHVAVVGDGHGALSVGVGFLDEFGYGGQSVKDGVLRVNVQVGKITHNKMVKWGVVCV